MILAAAYAAGFAAASPIPGDAAFALIRVPAGVSHIPVCVGARYQQRALVAFIYRRDRESFVRVGIARTRAYGDVTACPQSSVDVVIPDLRVDKDYVVGLFAAPEIRDPSSSDPSRVDTVGTIATLEPVLYLGLHIEK